jgi:hypothetical protein
MHPLLVTSLALLCLAAPAGAISITTLYAGYHEFNDPATGTGYYLFADVNTLTPSDYAERRGHILTGYLALAISRAEDCWSCYLLPDDVPESERFSVPLLGGFSFVAPSIYLGLFGGGYLIESTATGFTIRAGSLPDTNIPPEPVPDHGAGRWAAAVGLMSLILVRAIHSLKGRQQACRH